MEILDIILNIDDGNYWERIWNTTPEETEITWDNTLNDVQECVTAYYQAIADRENDPEQYLNLVLPQYWQIVRALNISRWGVDSLPSDSCYDVGIFSVGFRSLPIALSIAEIQPRQKIYFLHSDDTRAREKCDEIIDRVEEMFDTPPHPFCPLINSVDAGNLIARVQCAERREIVDPSDPVSTFRQIKDIIDQVRGDVKIALDLTGGKKTMVGGGFTAGSIYSLSPKCDMFYVDSLEYNERRGVPIPGTEFLSRLDNPYDVYNVQTVAQGKELFKRHNYQAAARLWKSVRNKLYNHAERYDFLVNEREEARDYYGSSHCYNRWDALDYQEAATRKTYSFGGDTYSWGYNEQHVRSGIDVLDILAQVINKSTLYAHEYRVIHYAVDRYQNGMRRKQNRRFADAIVRFAQVIEIICNYRIYRLATDNHLVKIGSNDSISLSANRIWEFGHLIKLLFGKARVDIGYATYHVVPNHRMQVANYGYRNPDQILEVIQPRNDFIHFNSPMRQAQTETDAENLRALAYKFLEKFISDYCVDYCTENSLSLDDLLELHKFCRWKEE